MSKNSHPQVISLITSHMYSARNSFIIFRLNIEFSSPVLSISHLGQTNRTSSVLSHPVKSRRRSSWVLSDNEYPFAKELLRGSFWSTSSRFDPHVHPFIQFATRLRGEHIVVVFSPRAELLRRPHRNTTNVTVDSWCKIILSPCYQEWNYSSG